ncbi:MAG: hypothetical protein AAB225_14075, partial [Acidobacteriota bacterium]
NVIYRVPRRYPGVARVVEKAQIEKLKPVAGNADVDALRACAEAAEKGPDSPAATAWEGTDVLRVRATVRSGEAILVQVSYDPSWRAWSDGRLLLIRKDAVGNMLIDAPPGTHDLKLAFETPLENRIGRFVSLGSALAVIVLIVAGSRRREV